MSKTNRKQEVKVLKAKRKELLAELKVSKRKFFKNLPKTFCSGYEIFLPEWQWHPRNRMGHKMSLKQQVTFLYDCIAHSKEVKKFIDEQVEKIKTSKENTDEKP